LIKVATLIEKKDGDISGKRTHNAVNGKRGQRHWNAGCKASKKGLDSIVEKRSAHEVAENTRKGGGKRNCEFFEIQLAEGKKKIRKKPQRKADLLLEGAGLRVGEKNLKGIWKKRY